MTRQHAGQARHCLPGGPATYLVGGAVPAVRRHQRSRSVLRDLIDHAQTRPGGSGFACWGPDATKPLRS